MASIASPVSAPVIDWKTRARVPLAAAAAILIAADFIVLGMHLADSARNAASADQPRTQARTSVTGPNAVVNADSLSAEATSARRTRTTTASGVLIGPVAPPVVIAAPGSNTGDGSPSTPTPTPTPSPAEPALQANVGVPALGANVGLGAGDNSCTTVDLTLIALGDCPAPEGDGAVIVQLGGSLLGS